jgi:chemosensory pili system protein ChpB (putative protein-glutamate methylesterase)
MPSQFDIGIISDSPLSRLRLKEMVERLNYSLLGIFSSENPHADELGEPHIWLLDLGEDAEDGLLDDLFDCSAKLIFCDDSIPSPNDENYSRWFRRMAEKLELACRPNSQIKGEPVKLMILPENDRRKPTSEKDKILHLPNRYLSCEQQAVNEVWILTASLGGPSAVKEFLDLLPKGLPVAILYAQHIYENQLDSLSDTLFRHCQLAVVKSGEFNELKNGRIHIVPVEQSIGFFPGGAVSYQGKNWLPPYSPNLNQVLSSACEVWGERCHSIVFSGMDNDGEEGNRLVQLAGGQVWCQSSDSATQASMPDSSSKYSHYRGSPAELAYKLLNHIVVKAIGIE